MPGEFFALESLSLPKNTAFGVINYCDQSRIRGSNEKLESAQIALCITEAGLECFTLEEFFRVIHHHLGLFW